MEHGEPTVTNPLPLGHRDAGPPVPGLVVVFAAGRAVTRTLAIGRGPFELGRESMPPGIPADPAMSRRHALVARDGARWQITDLGSHNGTAIDGIALRGERAGDGLRVLRLGQTVCLLEPDVRPFEPGGGADPAIVMGPRLHAIWRFLAQLADQPTLHIHGESGSGKELAARAFHALGATREGAFVAVNCAAIPPTLAEAMLFGSRRGAFSGADRDTEGLFQAAHRGTLFLDEVGELEPALQAKLLRVLETREVMPVGSTRAHPIDVRICSASHRDLKALVAQGRFREDLYFRLGRPEIVLPPLRERIDEIAAHVVRAVREVAAELRVDATLIEACMLRPWPGNVRELQLEVRQAAQHARADGSPVVSSAHLGPDAGRAVTAHPGPTTDEPEPASAAEPAREQILDALRRSGGRVAPAARSLGIARIRLRRWLEREGIDPSKLG